jgi:branched-chain amino acid transport system permease protein
MTRTIPILGRASPRVIVMLVAGLLVGILPAVPNLLGGFEVSLLIRIVLLALFAMSFNLLFGYTGLLSFGHAAFYGVGAYGLAIILSDQVPFVPGDAFLLALILTMALTVLVSMVVGALCVQRDELYFAMLTLAVNMVLYESAQQWTEVTGGANGINITPPTIDLFVLSFSSIETRTYFYFVYVVAVVSVLVMWRVVNSPYGEILIAIRENPERARFIGVPVTFFQWSSFLASGLFAGLAGALIAPLNFVIAPNVLHWSTGADPIFSTLIGGPTSFAGPIVGSVIFVLLQEMLTSITDFWRIGLGIILIPLVLFVPGGIVGYLTDEDTSMPPVFERARSEVVSFIEDARKSG